MLENLKLALIILLTGIVVVFAVLLLLILIIKLYSTAVSSAQNSIEARKIEKQAEQKPKSEENVPKVVETAVDVQPNEDDGAIPGEIIAVIAAAVDTIFGEGAVTIQSVRKARPQRDSVSGRSAWRAAGMAENTRVF